MEYTFRNFEHEINDNILYLKCTCNIKERGKETFYKNIEINKAFDISKDISNIELLYDKSEMITKENSNYTNCTDCIIFPVPDAIHFIVIPIKGISTIFKHPLIEYIYNSIEKCIDNIDKYSYNDKQDSNLNLADLDYLKSCLYEIQTIALSNFNKKE